MTHGHEDEVPQLEFPILLTALQSGYRSLQIQAL